MAPRPARSISQTIIDPMQEGAVYNMPLDSTSLQAADSPIFSAEADRAIPLPEPDDPPLIDGNNVDKPLNRTASNQENRTADRVPPVDSAGSLPVKRQPRKLMKSRGDSDTHLDNGIKVPSVAEKPATKEKGKGVLTKKPPDAGNVKNISEFDVQDGILHD